MPEKLPIRLSGFSYSLYGKMKPLAQMVSAPMPQRSQPELGGYENPLDSGHDLANDMCRI